MNLFKQEQLMIGLTILIMAVGVIIAICTGVMAKGQGKNPLLWGGISLVLGVFVFALVAYIPMLVLYFLSRKPGATSSALAASVFRFTTGGVVGAVVGFIIGYLLRPTILGEKIPLSIILSPENADRSFASEMFSHMLISIAGGVILGFVAAFFAGRRRIAA